MADPGLSSSRLEDLQMRWQQDPDSRIYLQLAEEYRKLDRHPEAIEVLKRGLQKRPHDLSGQVALGRCHLEMEELEAAAAVLEGVVSRDPTHIVGNKLLLETYLASGNAAKAGERLDLYKLLNSSDPDLAGLEQRLRGLRSATPRRPGVPEPAAVTTAEMPSLPASDEPPPPPPADFAAAAPELEVEVDEVEEVAAAEEIAAAEEVASGTSAGSRDPDSAFETWPEGSLRMESSYESEFAAEPMAPEPAVPTAAPFELEEDSATGPQAEPSPRSDLEPELVQRDVAKLDLAEGEIFHLGPAPPPPSLDELWGWLASETAAAPEPVEKPPAWEPPQETATLDEPQPGPAAGEQLAAVVDDEGPAAETAVAGEEEPASATLGELYLRQGHFAEAEKVFRQVLRRSPRNAVALAGLERIRGEESLTAHAVLASVAEEAPEGLTTKKIRMLEGYLEHLRRAAGEAHVR